MVDSIEKIFSKARSLYPQERARFVTSVDNTKVEVFVINEKGESWLDSCIFENYLRRNTNALELYRVLKEEGNGLSTQRYYRRKVEFINAILQKAKT